MTHEMVLNNKVQNQIMIMRGRKVMLDRDLAALYKVPTKVLNQAVKRNRYRFPLDFMFQLNRAEMENWKSQIVTSNFAKERMSLRKKPYAFTEHGILMLSSVLNSKRAIQVNIQIMRIFMKMQELAMTHKDLVLKIEEMERKYDKQFQVVFKAIKLLLEEKPKGEGGKRFEV